MKVRDPLVLVLIKDGQVIVKATAGVQVGVVLETEHVEIPDDYQALPVQSRHTLPIWIDNPLLGTSQPRM